MAVDPAITGRTWPPTRVVEVGREDVRRFAEAVGSTDPAHTDPEHARALGHPDVVAPPTFAVGIAQLADGEVVRDPEAGIDFTRVVHGEQRFVHHRPVVAGDRLVARTTVDAVRSAGGHSMVTMRAEVTDADGAAVCTATSMLVVRGEDA